MLLNEPPYYNSIVLFEGSLRGLSSTVFDWFLFVCMVGKWRKNDVSLRDIYLGCTTIAWFAMNKAVSADTMAVAVENRTFELKVNSGDIGYSDLYEYIPDADYKDYTELQTNTGANQETVRWRLTSGSSDVLKPGAQGVLEFEVVSNGSDISGLKYKLDLRCFTATTVTETTTDEHNNTVKSERVTGLEEITSSTTSQDEKDGKTYLNSHIMFFKHRTGNSESIYQYNGFISDVSDFELELDSNNKAKIYWIWPKTFGQIALDSSNISDRSYLGNNAVSVLNSAGETADRGSVTTYLNSTKDNKSVVFKGNGSYGTLLSSLYSKRENSENFTTEYTALSSGYNAADLVIGKNVGYILVMLTASI